MVGIFGGIFEDGGGGAGFFEGEGDMGKGGFWDMGVREDVVGVAL